VVWFERALPVRRHLSFASDPLSKQHSIAGEDREAGVCADVRPYARLFSG
jgi:hypothetical protein